jgi:hypothetical protein
LVGSVEVSDERGRAGSVRFGLDGCPDGENNEERKKSNMVFIGRKLSSALEEIYGETGAVRSSC